MLPAGEARECISSSSWGVICHPGSRMWVNNQSRVDRTPHQPHRRTTARYARPRSDKASIWLGKTNRTHSSAANQNHGPVFRAGNVEHACVLLLLLLHSAANDIPQLGIAHPRSHRVPQADFFVAEQAHLFTVFHFM